MNCHVHPTTTETATTITSFIYIQFPHTQKKSLQQIQAEIVEIVVNPRMYTRTHTRPWIIAAIKLALLYKINHFFVSHDVVYDIIVRSIKSSFSDGKSENSVKMGNHPKTIPRCLMIRFFQSLSKGKILTAYKNAVVMAISKKPSKQPGTLIFENTAFSILLHFFD